MSEQQTTKVDTDLQDELMSNEMMERAEEAQITGITRQRRNRVSIDFSINGSADFSIESHIFDNKGLLQRVLRYHNLRENEVTEVIGKSVPIETEPEPKVNISEVEYTEDEHESDDAKQFGSEFAFRSLFLMIASVTFGLSATMTVLSFDAIQFILALLSAGCIALGLIYTDQVLEKIENTGFSWQNDIGQ